MTPLAFAVIAALGNLLGGLVVVRRSSRGLRTLDLSIAFGAGFMMSVVVLGLIPEVGRQGAAGAAYMLGGYLLVHVSQHVLAPHFHFGEETHALSSVVSVSALLGILLHTFFDGVAIASGFLTSSHLGLLLFLAVLLHKLPEGVTVASITLAGGRSARLALGAAVAIGIATILGVVATSAFSALASHGLALSAGVTLYVAASNLVPEFQSKRGWSAPTAFFAGVGVYALTELLLQRNGLS